MATSRLPTEAANVFCPTLFRSLHLPNGVGDALLGIVFCQRENAFELDGQREPVYIGDGFEERNQREAASMPLAAAKAAQAAEAGVFNGLVNLQMLQLHDNQIEDLEAYVTSWPLMQQFVP